MIALFLFAAILVLIVPGLSALANLYSQDELNEMGICLDHSRA